jgi:putative ABC transport system permease protein
MPIAVLKGNVSRGAKSGRMRGVLVVFQFTTSIFLIIGTLVIHRQMNYILNTKIGFDKDQVIMIEGTNTLDQQKTFKEELKQVPHVEHVSISGYIPIAGSKRDQNQFWRDGKSKEEQGIGAQKWYVDEDYMKTLGMRLVEGRTFDPDIKSDTSAMIINQAMAKEFGFEKPVGELIQNWETWHIIGVVEDFNFESMKGKIRPLAFVYGDWGATISVKVKTEDMQQTLAAIGAVWDRFMPNQPIRYKFLDDSYARMYEDVQRMGRIFTCFAVLALIVACLGLFALSVFMVEQRGKEISIRLVLGASVNNIFTMVTQNFVILVMISIVLAVPLGYYAMQTWLQNYEYRIPLTWDIFLIAGFAAIVIALLTVSYQSIKVAIANPVDRLRSE